MTEANNAQASGLAERIAWNADGLVPAIVQDALSKEVLMLAYMNRESLAKSLESGQTWFWSRSRGELWNKGATSGHTQRIVSLAYDCDADTLLVKVVQQGPACHTGAYSCFYSEAFAVPAAGKTAEAAEAAGDAENAEAAEIAGDAEAAGDAETAEAAEAAGDVGIAKAARAAEAAESARTAEAAAKADRFGPLSRLEETIARRDAERPEGAYTTYLFEKGVDKILKKVGEETAEVIIAAKNRDARELRCEAADLIFHLMVLMREQGIPLDDVLEELEFRHRKPVKKD